MAVKRPKSHRIGKMGTDLFNASLPSDELIDFLFSEIPQQEDYSIDGLIQVFSKEVHTGEIYFVQVKGAEKLKHNKEGQTVYYLDIKHAEFFIDTLKQPIVIILCDTTNRKVYWHDIQINEITLKAYKESLEKGKDLKIIVDQKLTLPETSTQFYSYLQEAFRRIVDREEARKLADQSITDALKQINDFEASALKLKGYKAHQGQLDNESKPPIFSLFNKQTGKEIHYLQGEDFTKDDVLKIQTQFKFPKTEEGMKAFDILQSVIKGEAESVELNGKYLAKLKAYTDSRILEDTTDNKSVVFKIEPTKNTVDVYLKAVGSKEEIKIQAQSWLFKNTLNLDNCSYSNQPLLFKLKVNITDSVGTYSYSINTDYVKNINNAIFLEDFLYEFSQIGEIYIFHEGIKRKVFSVSSTANNLPSKEENPYYQLLLQLRNIENATNAKFPFPIPDDISSNEVMRIHNTANLLQNGKLKADLTLEFELNKKLKSEEYIAFETDVIDVLLGQPIKVLNKIVKVCGKIAHIENIKNKYKILIKGADIEIV